IRLVCSHSVPIQYSVALEYRSESLSFIIPLTTNEKNRHDGRDNSMNDLANPSSYSRIAPDARCKCVQTADKRFLSYFAAANQLIAKSWNIAVPIFLTHKHNQQPTPLYELT